jgi:hypothetical protein
LNSEEKIVLEILKPALDFVQKCPVDSKVIDDSFPTLKCPVCGTAFCMFPCAEKLALKSKKCPTCKKFEMSGLAEIVRNAAYVVKLEELKSRGAVSDSTYKKLKLEYENRSRDAIQRVYTTGAAQE